MTPSWISRARSIRCSSWRASSACFATVRATDGQEAEARYQRMLAAAKANPAATDWQALRFAYADRASFFAANEGRRGIRTDDGSGAALCSNA